MGKLGRSLWIAVPLILLGGAAALGITPAYLFAAPAMGSGIAAKLACSARFVSFQEESAIAVDIASYSPLLDLVDIHYDHQNKRSVASLLGYESEARYRPGLGCTLEIGDSSGLDAIRVPDLPRSQAPWPAGDGVNTIKSVLQGKLDQVLTRDNNEGLNTRALLLVQDGRIVAESYAPGFGPDSRLLGWSMAKSVTAMLLGNLEYRQLLSVTETGLFESWDDERAAISLEHLLQMSSGLDFSETYAPAEDATRMLFQSFSVSDYAVRSPLAFQPGEHFSYSSGTTNLLSRLIHERLGGEAERSYRDMSESFFQPLGMQNTLFEPDASGVPIGSSYMYASARDWARIGQLMLNGGEINGQRLLSADWVTRASLPNESNNQRSYGYQFWLNRGDAELRWPSLPADAYAALGNREQTVLIVPSRSTVLVRLGWSAGDYPKDSRFAEILAAAASN